MEEEKQALRATLESILLDIRKGENNGAVDDDRHNQRHIFAGIAYKLFGIVQHIDLSWIVHFILTEREEKRDRTIIVLPTCHRRLEK